MQKDYPEISKQVVDCELLKDWDGIRQYIC